MIPVTSPLTAGPLQLPRSTPVIGKAVSHTVIWGGQGHGPATVEWQVATCELAQAAAFLSLYCGLTVMPEWFLLRAAPMAPPGVRTTGSPGPEAASPQQDDQLAQQWALGEEHTVQGLPVRQRTPQVRAGQRQVPLGASRHAAAVT